MYSVKKNILFSLGLSVLFVLTGCSNSDGYSTSDSKIAGWYMQTAAYATADDGKVYEHTTAGVFGELVQSEDGQDRHDVPGYGSAILQVVFTPAWGNDGYFSDYHAFDPLNNAKKSWTFQVKNQHTVDLANAPLRLTLDGVYHVTYKETVDGGVKYETSKTVSSLKDEIVLVDVDNHKTYSAQQLPSTELNMGGLHTRTFRWVIGEVSDEDYLPLTLPSAAKASTLVSGATEEFTDNAMNKENAPLPPSF